MISKLLKDIYYSLCILIKSYQIEPHCFSVVITVETQKK